MHIGTFAQPHISQHICTSAHLHMILITGATGFLGAELALQLIKQGNSVRCTRRSTSKIPAILVPHSAQIEWVEADMMDADGLDAALQGVDRVYHCAAWVSLRQADKDGMIRQNVRSTANLVDLCLDKHIRLVHTSSVAAIGLAKPGDLITENHHLDQALETDGYALSKLESEMEVWRGIAEGLDAVIVNPAIIIGASAGVNGSGELFKLVRKGLKFYTNGSCGFVDVKDVAKCMIALMNTDITAQRYIVSAENCNFRDIITWIADGFGVEPPSKYARPWMLGLAWRFARLWGWLTHSKPMLDKVSAQSASVTRDYNNSKIKKAIGVEFRPVREVVTEICRETNKAAD